MYDYISIDKARCPTPGYDAPPLSAVQVKGSNPVQDDIDVKY
jgi:hypothetical protein